MAVPKKLTGRILDGSNNPISGVVQAQMKTLAFVNNGEVVPRVVLAIADATGNYAFDPAAAVPNGLYSNADMTPANSYWTIQHVAGGVPYPAFAVVIPNTADPFAVTDPGIVVSSPALPAQYVIGPSTALPATAITGLATGQVAIGTAGAPVARALVVGDVTGAIPLDSASASNVLAGGSLIPGGAGATALLNERIRLPYNSGISAYRRDGTTVVNAINVGNYPGADGGVFNIAYVGDPKLDFVTFLSTIDAGSGDIVDMVHVGNLYANIDTRLMQGLGVSAPGYDTKVVGIASMDLGGGGLGGLKDRLIFNSGKSIANSLATFQNLGAVQLLSDTMKLQFGTLSNAALAYSAATGSPGLLATGDLAASGLVQAGGNLQTASGNVMATTNVAVALYTNNITLLPVAQFQNTSGTPTGYLSVQSAGGASPTVAVSVSGTAANGNLSLQGKGTGLVSIASSTQQVGYFGSAGSTKRATTADSTDLASVITLANALKADLIAYGLKS